MLVIGNKVAWASSKIITNWAFIIGDKQNIADGLLHKNVSQLPFTLIPNIIALEVLENFEETFSRPFRRKKIALKLKGKNSG